MEEDFGMYPEVLELVRVFVVLWFLMDIRSEAHQGVKNDRYNHCVLYT